MRAFHAARYRDAIFTICRAARAGPVPSGSRNFVNPKTGASSLQFASVCNLESDMKSIASFVLILGLGTAAHAQVVGALADIAVIDRDSGTTLSPHYYRGEYWVAGRPGARYSIEIRNRLGERLLAVTSVDGVNVISGATAGWDQTGYVFGPGERYQITGWRKSDAEVAAFTFTDSANSYAERTGRPANVGVIGVAIFRERQPEAAYVAPALPSAAPPAAPSSLDSDTRNAADSAARSESTAQSAAAAGAGARAAAPAAREANSPPSSALLTQMAPLARKLGTGHGEREYSYVNRTEFSRMQAQPNEVIRIHYDSMDNLLAMGIIKRPRPAPPMVNPFPASPAEQYVPDPPG
jgi:hypothetical protein